MSGVHKDHKNTKRRFGRYMKQLRELEAGADMADPDRPMHAFNDVLNRTASQPVECEEQLQILQAGVGHLLEHAGAPAGGLGSAIDAALARAITEAASPLDGALLALARHQVRGGRINAPASTARSRASRSKFEKGIEIQRRLDNNCPVTDAENDVSLELWYDTVCNIALGGIRDELELKTLNEGISYVMKRDKFDGSVDDAIDYALSLAYDIMEVNEEAWLIALARFRMRGYSAPAWRRDVLRGRFGYAAPGATG